MSYQNEWLLFEAEDEFDEIKHREPTEELLFYRAVASGDIKTVKKNCERQRFTECDGVGVLSKNAVTNMKYHFVITTAMITRLCKQNGMEMEQAFRLSDFYIQKLDGIHTVEEVQSLHDEMVMDYTEKMRRYFRDNTYSKHINASKEYIYSHIKERITIEDLADSLGVSASYLSRLFKKETGISVSAYIRRQKIEMAKNLLQYSDYPIIEIANRLSFSSQSHFIQQFREVDIRRRKRNADHALCHRFDRGNLGQSVVVRRTFVFQHSLETFGNITCRQLRTRPELDALFYRKAERGSIARIVLAQLVFECKIVFYLKKALVKRLTQHAVDLGAVHDRIERCARAIPRQTEIRVRHIHVVYRCAVAVVSLSKWERAAAEHDQSRHCQRQRTFFPTFHCIDPFAYRQIMPPCTPRTPCVTRCDQNSSE